MEIKNVFDKLMINDDKFINDDYDQNFLKNKNYHYLAATKLKHYQDNFL